MWQRICRAGLLWPTLFALPALAVLLGLGTWQLNRKAWKEGVIGQINARASAPPMPLAEVLGRMTASHPPGEDSGVGEYTRVLVRGTFDHGRELFVYAPHPRFGPGYHVYTPLILSRSACTRFVLVNRGFVPEALRAPDKRPEGQIGAPRQGGEAGAADVVGLLRFAERPGAFTPANEPQKNLWFWRDVAGMAKAAAPEQGSCPVHFVIDAEAEPANPGGWPRGGTTNLKLANRHLEYALTWFGLAATLVGVYMAFAWGRLRGA